MGFLSGESYFGIVRGSNGRGVEKSAKKKKRCAICKINVKGK